MNEGHQFPSRHPVWSYGACAIGFALWLFFLWWIFSSQFNTVQRLNLTTYIETGLFGRSSSSVSSYRLPYVVVQDGAGRLALDGEIAPVETISGNEGYALTRQARREGFTGIALYDKRFNNKWLHHSLQNYIYNSRSIWSYVEYPTCGALALLILMLWIAGPKDTERARIRREGIQTDGPEMVTPAEFNRRVQGDGIGLIHEAHKQFPAVRKNNLELVRIPLEAESQHFLVLGDTGTAKSAVMRQMLVQIRDRGEAAVIYDPQCEYVPEFYDPEQGDVILNPLDARSPYWPPGDEVSREAESLTVATSLFPDQKGELPFFADAKRRIFARLLTFKPSPQELVSWMCNAEEIDRRVRGSDAESMIDPHAGPQRGGVLASLNMAAASLKLLREEGQARQRWNSIEWVENRRGFLFLTSTPSAQDALQPLVSMQLDLLMLRLLSDRNAAKAPVWIVLDEAADLKHLPQLPKALAQSRKANCRIVLGFQGIGQVEEFYGRIGKTMISQPHSRVYMRTGEPEAAKWISSALGEASIVRLRETWATGADGKRTWSETIDPPRAKPLVPYSKILSLPKLHGYFKYEGLVVALRIHYIHLPKRCQGFIEHSATERPHVEPIQSSKRPTPNPSDLNTHAIFFE